MASRLVCFTPDRAVQVWALAGDILLCSWARHFTHIVSPHPVTSCYRNWDKLRPAGPLGSSMHTLPLGPNYENYNWQCMCKVLINFFHIQYRSKVSWQSIEPRYSILDNFEYRVSSLESRKIMSLALDWSLKKLIAQMGRKPNTCTCRVSVLRAIVPLTLKSENK